MQIKSKKHFGQHFIFDEQVNQAIAASAGDLKDYHVLEIGPGPGGLTKAILKNNPHKLTSIEIDTQFELIHRQITKEHNETYEMLLQDALVFQEELLSDKKIKIIANLPYNIATSLILKWLEKPHLFETIIITIQKEVADRIISPPSCKDYGRLSICAQLICETRKLFDLSPEVFSPPPKVTSSVIELKPIMNPKYKINTKKIKEVTRILFSKRRKTIRKILKDTIKESEEMLKKLNIDSNLRPENLTIEQVYYLSEEIFPDNETSLINPVI